MAVEADTGVISTHFFSGVSSDTKKNIGSGVSGATVTLTPGPDLKQWTWGATGLDEAYIPKN